MPISLQSPAPPPIIVKIYETPHDPTGIADVLIGSLGLTGALIVAAIVLGIAAAGFLFWIRGRN